MGTLAQTAQAAPIKAIIAADSGSGKSGALWSLANAGFKLRIFDADKGTPILASALRAAGREDILASDQVQVCSFTDVLERDAVSGHMKPKGSAKAWPNLMDALNKWPDDPDKKGIATWGKDTVAVIDSLTMFGRHAILYAQQMEGRNRWKREIQHYGTAMAQLEGLFGLLYGDEIKCHVLFMTHIKQEFRDVKVGDDKTIKEFIGAFPSSLGQGLNDVIPRYVNNILSIKIVGEGPNAKRYLTTKPTANRIITKTSELSVKDEYLLATGRKPEKGLAEFFADNGYPGPGQ
jgi:hypothetical protein